MSIYTPSLEYYVYAYLREDGTPYYIGMGRNYRIYSKLKRIKPPRNKRYAIIVEKHLTQVGAIALERRLIEWYGRKDIDTGILRNKTAGGEGNPELSADTLKRMSDKAKESWQKGVFDNIKRKDQSGKNNSFYGRKHTSEAREKIRESKKGRIHSDDTKQKICDALKAYNQSAQAKEQKSQVMRDRWQSPEYREKIRSKRLGVKRGPYRKKSLLVNEQLNG